MRRADSQASVASISSDVSGVGNYEVGDRVQIDDRKGSIAFIGPTQFADGEWIGLILDEPNGKNDGTVKGIRYFECGPNYGLFCKSSRLRRIVQREPISEHAAEYGFDIGDIVSTPGQKIGQLRFLGPTQFAPGIWAGVELDKPNGKNDGSVQGVRYFTCKPLFGLFAPAGKTEIVNSTQSTFRHTKSSLLRYEQQKGKLGGSRESLSSIGASSLASSRFNYMKKTPTATRNMASSSVVSALQAALKEKEQHLLQVMEECEMLRLETGQVKQERSPTPVDAVKNAVNPLKAQLSERDKTIEELVFRIEELGVELDFLREEKSVSKSKLDDAEQEQHLKQRIQSLELLLEESTNREVDLRETFKKFKKEATENSEGQKNLLLETISRQDAEIKRLTLQNEEVKTTEEDAVNKELLATAHFEKRQAELLAEVERLQKENADLSKAAEIERDKVTTKTQQVSQFEKLQTELLAEVERLQKENADLLKAVEIERDKVTVMTEQASQKIKTLEEQLDTANKSTQDVLTQIQNAIKENEALQKQLTAEKLRQNDSAQQINSLQKEVKDLQESKLILEGEFSSSNTLVEALTSRISELTANITSNEQKLSQETQQRVKAENEIHDLQAELSPTKQTLELTKAEVDKLSLELQDLRKISSDDKVKLAQVEERFLATSDSVKHLEADVKKAHDEATARIDALNKAHVEEQALLKRQIEDITKIAEHAKLSSAKVTADYDSQIEALSSVIENLRKDLAMETERREKSETHLQSLQAEVAAAREAMESAKLGGDELSGHLAEARKSLAEETTKRQQLEERFKKLTLTNEELNENIKNVKQETDLKLKEATQQLLSTKEQLLLQIKEQEAFHEKAKTHALEEVTILQDNVEKLNKLMAAEGAKLALEVQRREEAERLLEAARTDLQTEKAKSSSSATDKEQVLTELEALRVKVSDEQMEKLELEKKIQELEQHYEEQIQQSNIQKHKLEDSLKDLEQKHKTELEQLNNAFANKTDAETDARNKFVDAERRVVELNMDVTNLQEENQHFKNRIGELTMELSQRVEEYEHAEKLHKDKLADKEKIISDETANKLKLEATVTELRNQLEVLTEDGSKSSTKYLEEIELLKANIDKLTAELQVQTTSATSAKQEIAKLLEENKIEQEKLSAELQLNVMQLASMTSEKKMLADRCESLEISLSELKSQIANASSLDSTHERKINLLQSELDETRKTLESERQKNESNVFKLESELEALRNMSRNSGQSNETMVNEFAVAMTQIKELNAKNKAILCQMEDTEAELIRLRNGEKAMQEREAQAATKFNLLMEMDAQWKKKEARYQDQIEEYESKLELEKKRTITNETQQLQKTVDFLNSIIADHVKKEALFRRKIESLEEEINSGAVQLMKDKDRRKSRKERQAPRKYCDICDMFDVHETYECSKQGNSASEERTENAGSSWPAEGVPITPPRRLEYCDACEDFGHATKAPKICPFYSEKKDYTF